MPDTIFSAEDIRQCILEVLHDFWIQDPFEFVILEQIKDKHMHLKELDDAVLLGNLEYLASTGLIDGQRTVTGLKGARISSLGVFIIETTRIPNDIDIRRKILEETKKIYDKDPYASVGRKHLTVSTGFSDMEVIRSVKYLSDLGYLVMSGFYGSPIPDFHARISPLGIDFLSQPTRLEAEIRFMTNAYSLLYSLEHRLRIFIESRLKQVYGDSWWDKSVTPGLRRKASNNKSRETDSMLGMIHFVNFEDLRRIIINNWPEVFVKYFRTQDGIIARLNELEPLRHKIAHTRLLSNGEFLKLQMFHKEIIGLISEN